MQYTILDIECDGLLDTVSKIHCLSYQTFDNGVRVDEGTLTNYNQIRDFVESCDTIVGHNIIRYDIPVMEKILGIKIEARLIDTLALSWYLYPTQLRHGLEHWGDILGVQKPHISDWSNLSIEDYSNRCETDVRINTLLFDRQKNYLDILYEYDQIKISNLINYLGFKLDCAREQEEVKCKVNKQSILKSIEELDNLRLEKINSLINSMPKVIGYKEIRLPSKTHRNDGSLSKAGEKWFALLEENDLPEDYDDVVVIKVSEEDGNPQSTSQLKDWLFALGWEPETFEYRKNTKGEINEVPQIYVDNEVCESIKKLYVIEPVLENLDMLSLIEHRIGIFKSFLDSMDSEDYVTPEVRGFTNTLRFRHSKPIVNLPKVFKFYGEQIRGSIVAPSEAHLLCGSDMSSLEDSTKQHYMYFFDPNYVTQMRVPGFDPHIDIAVLANMMSEEEASEYKRIKKKASDADKDLGPKPTAEEYTLFKRLDEIRNTSKTVNFAGVYGAGPPKIAQTAGMPLEQAAKLHKTYWSRNKAVKQVANSCKVKSTAVDGVEQMWLLNPISGFYYSLRYEKDKFSTLNQGTGVYCFDLWVREVRSRGIKVMFQYHDEIAFPLLKGKDSEVRDKLQNAIERVNEILKLNVPLGVSVAFGDNYSDIH